MSKLMSRIFMLVFSILCFSSAITAQGTEAMVDQVLAEMVSKGELTAADVDEYIMTDHYASQRSNLDHMYFCQTKNGIEVHGAVGAVHVMSDGKILTKNVGFVNNLDGRISGSTSPTTGVLAAVRSAAKAMNYSITKDLTIIENIGGPAQKFVISDGGISIDNITAQLKFVNTGKQVKLSWEIFIYELSGNHAYNLRIDASTGELLDQDDMVNTCFEELHDHSSDHTDHDHNVTAPTTKAEKKATGNGFNPLSDPLAIFAPDSYKVFAYPQESPYNGPVPTTVVDPADATASPFGWHDIDGTAGAEFTTTQGNNTHAYLDRDGDNLPDGPSPDGGATLDFLFNYGPGDTAPTDDMGGDPTTYQEASQTNLFYWTNLFHDVTYIHGFDEVSGNFQVNNYGNGGIGNDDVRAECQDQALTGGNCNANFFTPSDGSRPRMQMFICNLAPVMGGGPAVRDVSLDAGVVNHEYGHGVSNRLVGGPGNVGCLNNAEQMGEGWSDFYTLILSIEPGDLGTDSRGIGAYLLGQGINGTGIRVSPFNNGLPYSTDFLVNNHSYGQLNVSPVFPNGPGLTRPHGLGYLWATMLWEMTWELIDAYGFNPDISQDWTTGGNNLALRLVQEGMKMTACNPGFVDGRDGILAADVALTGGANQCLIWSAFARRGLGFSADQGSPFDSFDGVEAFDMPSSCILEATPAYLDICAGDQALFNLNVAPAMGPITLSQTGAPGGAVVILGPNPVPMAGGMATLTIDNTIAVSAGTYNIDITSDDMMGTVFMTSVELVVTADPPTAQNLISPVDMSSGLLQPNLVWDVTNGANSWLLEVDDDPGFGSPEVSETLVVGNYHFNDGMDGVTYYWRVTGINGCGSETSPIWSFTSAAVSCNFYPSTDVPVIISVGPAAIYTSELTIPANPSGNCIDINVENINITHTWSGDITLTLISPSGTRVQLLDNDCGRADDIIINFDDEAPFGPLCPTTDNGFYTPEQPISSVYGENLSGVWTLEVEDVASLDGGSLNSWGLNICTSDTQLCYTDADNDGYGDPATEVETCEPCALGQVTNDLDCDDMDPTIFPGQNCDIAPIPTLGEWGIIILSFLLMIIGIAAVRQRKTVLG